MKDFYSPRSIQWLIQTSGFAVLGQHIANHSKDSCVYRDNSKGGIKYWLKESLLKLFPQLAISIFTYHWALVCQKS